VLTRLPGIRRAFSLSFSASLLFGPRGQIPFSRRFRLDAGFLQRGTLRNLERARIQRVEGGWSGRGGRGEERDGKRMSRRGRYMSDLRGKNTIRPREKAREETMNDSPISLSRLFCAASFSPFLMLSPSSALPLPALPLFSFLSFGRRARGEAGVRSSSPSLLSPRIRIR